MIPGHDTRQPEDRWHFDYPERLQIDPDPAPVPWGWIALAVVALVGAVWWIG